MAGIRINDGSLKEEMKHTNNEQTTPTVSIIIPAHNEEATIGKCLASLENLNYPSDKLEIILINDGSTDSTKKISENQRQRLNYKYLETEGVGPSKARNIGLKEASGEYVAFTDADCVVDKEWLSELLKGFIAEDVAGVGGSQDTPDDATEFERKFHFFLLSMHFICEYIKKRDKIELVNHVASCNAMYKREVIEEVGGFDERLWPGEDVDLDYKIRHRGYKMAYNPKAIVAHHRPKNLKSFFNMMKRYGWAQAYLIRKYGFFRKLHYVPFAEVLIFVGWALTMIYNLYLGVGLVVAVVLGVVIAFVFRDGLKRGLDNFVIFVITMVGWNVGFGECLIEWRRK